MTTEEAWAHVLKQAPAKNAEDAEAIFVLGKALFDNMAAISTSLRDISFELNEIKQIYSNRS